MSAPIQSTTKDPEESIEMGKRYGIRNERGFSLIEMLTVMAIMAILAAIAVPTFTGSKRNGQDGMAQTSLKSALSAERTHYVDYQKYTNNSVLLREIETQLNFTTSDAKLSGVKAVTAGSSIGPPPVTEQAVVLVSTSESGAQFCLMNIATTLSANLNGFSAPGTYYAKNPNPVTTPPTNVTITQCAPGTYSLNEW
jgi:prepilin-type N-terminal cleavage/methylation domain-containing protein